jgi:hypothetical protein
VAGAVADGRGVEGRTVGADVGRAVGCDPAPPEPPPPDAGSEEVAVSPLAEGPAEPEASAEADANGEPGEAASVQEGLASDGEAPGVVAAPASPTGPEVRMATAKTMTARAATAWVRESIGASWC